MLNQYFSIYKTIVNQYFSNSIKRKRNNIEPRLFQYYSNAKTVKIILSFTVTTNKHTQNQQAHKHTSQTTNIHTAPQNQQQQHQQQNMATTPEWAQT